jgi:hypothetical protein
MEHISDVLQDEAEKLDAKAEPGEKKRFFSVSLKKLIILSVLTFGLYQVYWFYKHHRAIKGKEEHSVVSFGKSLFAIFFCFKLFRKVLKEAKEKGYPIKNESIILAIVFIALWFVGTGGGVATYSLWSLLSFIPLTYVQHAADFVNKHHDEKHIPEGSWHWGEISSAIMGGLALCIMFAQAFVPIF